jgi:hypothetical protein
MSLNLYTTQAKVSDAALTWHQPVTHTDGWLGCFTMVSRLEAENIFEAAVTEIPRVAESIAGISSELRERAFRAAERSYQRTAQDLGFAQADAQVWISAIMFRLRSEVTALNGERLNGAAALYKKKIL